MALLFGNILLDAVALSSITIGMLWILFEIFWVLLV